MKTRIAKIIPYYGVWPEYIGIYLNSCRHNPLIDFIFVTNLILPENISSSNIKSVYLTMAELKLRIQDKFGIATHHISPYKICDFRPAFGILFDDILAEYDFWASGDIDLIYGDIQHFLSPQLLDYYDLISFKQKYMHGPLSFYRNTPKVNKLFMDYGGYLQVFQDPRSRFFDEFGTGGFHDQYEAQTPASEWVMDNISAIVITASENGLVRFHRDRKMCEKLSFKELLVYDTGRVFDFNTKKGYVFYHWVLEKRYIWFNYPSWFSNEKLPNKFYIDITGFYTEQQFRFYPIIKYYRYFTGTLAWWYLKATNYIKRKLKINITYDTYPNHVGWIKKI